MVKIIGTGISGLVGSRVRELLTYDFTEISYETGIDIRKIDLVEEAIGKSQAEIVLHMAAKTDVDECEKDKEKDTITLHNLNPKKQKEDLMEEATAWAINVFGTKNVVDICKKYSKKIIYISTDFVFDGMNTPENGYAENDTPNPVNWYARTKFEGEKIIRESGSPYLIVRIAYPYRASFALKDDFVQSIRKLLNEKKPIRAVTDHIITPTFIDDIAEALNSLIETGATGIYHVVGSQFLNPYEASKLVASTFHYEESFIETTTRENYFQGRASRPFNLSINNDKIEKLGIKMKTFKEGLAEIKKQLEKN